LPLQGGQGIGDLYRRKKKESTLYEWGLVGVQGINRMRRIEEG